jgi:glycosyltransferase involved in cell wall biosynthesis
MTLTNNSFRGGGDPRVSVVIPTLNGQRNVAWALERLPDLVDEVILVDARPGKRAALRAGFAAARGAYIVMIDGDGSIDPAEIERFVNALRSGCDLDSKGREHVAQDGAERRRCDIAATGAASEFL